MSDVSAPQTYSEDLVRILQTLTQEQLQGFIDKVRSLRGYEPKVGVVGKTGVGKSTLCNALFGRDAVKVSDVAAGTTSPQEILLKLTDEKGIKLIDCPGVGQTEAKDREYRDLYSKLIPGLDLVLWVVKADDRAYAIEEAVHRSVVKPSLGVSVPFMVAINQSDKIEPFRDWDMDRRLPGPRQLENLRVKVSIVRELFGIPEVKVIPVSAIEGYNLDTLVNTMVLSLPPHKQYGFVNAVKKDFVSPVARKLADDSFRQELKGALVTLGVGAATIAIVLAPQIIPAILASAGAAAAMKKGQRSA